MVNFYQLFKTLAKLLQITALSLGFTGDIATTTAHYGGHNSNNYGMLWNIYTYGISILFAGGIAITLNIDSIYIYHILNEINRQTYGQ